MNPDRPSNLVAVTGLTPAILTETVWALAHEDQPVIPERVVAITTNAGKAHMVKEVLTPRADFGGVTVWESLRQALRDEGLDVENRLKFGDTSNSLKVLESFADEGGGLAQELNDIRSPEDNRAAADGLLEILRGFVEHPRHQLVVSIAGGRKTMGALLYACCTLAARRDDRVTHVLLDDPAFEFARGFYFPCQPNQELTNRAGEKLGLDPGKATVTLADVPFVPIRELFVEEWGESPSSFSALVMRYRDGIEDHRKRQLDAVETWLDGPKKTWHVNGKSIELTPRAACVLWTLIDRHQKNLPWLKDFNKAAKEVEAAREKIAQTKDEKNFADWRYALDSGFVETDVSKSLTELRDGLKKMDLGHLVADLLPTRIVGIDGRIKAHQIFPNGKTDA